ncbi:MAG: DNA polymerase III subunit beta [Paenibacillus sp. RIFOXYA1_FULL_44_5]|nr:MAG: DNA polymerase III subunit beta [Paenibacillus sp. RIFOXYA1_FULL_44_5]
MKFSILKNALNHAIQHVSKAVTNRSTIPILSGIKLEANENGLQLTASDTDISIQSFIPIKANDQENIQLYQKGSIVLPAKFFVDIIRKLPTEKIEIEVTERFHTYIRSGSIDIQMNGLDPEEYPVLPKIEEHQTFSIPSDLLKTMIRQTAFAVLLNESTPILTGVLWTLTGKTLKFIGCDRHRLASREAQIESNIEFDHQNIVIAGKNLNELYKLLPDQNTVVDIVMAENQIMVRIDSILFYSRILNGTYPDVSKVIPHSFKSDLLIQTNELADAIDRAYLLSKEDKTNIVKLTMQENNSIEISSSSNELGKVTEILYVQHMEGELFKVAFNSKYMLDALKTIDSDIIEIKFSGSMQPIIIKPKDHSLVLQVILPLRTAN